MRAHAAKVNDMIALYLSDISKFPLLSEQEEVELVEQYRRGRRGSSAARDKLVAHNLRLVFALAKKYVDVHDDDFMDLLQEGALGLFRAVRKYELGKGTRFASYAHYWVLDAISRHVSSNTTIRIPEWIEDERRSAEKRGAEASSVIVPTTVSLSSPTTRNHDGDDEELEDTLMMDAEPVDQEALDSVCVADAHTIIRRLAASRDERTARLGLVLRRRYINHWTLQATGTTLGLSRERVRQLEADGLELLREKMERLGWQPEKKRKQKTEN